MKRTKADGPLPAADYFFLGRLNECAKWKDPERKNKYNYQRNKPAHENNYIQKQSDCNSNLLFHKNLKL